MSYLPQSTPLGKLEMLEVYGFYDRPLLFACRNLSDGHYLAVLRDEAEDFDVWLYVGVSRSRLEHVRSGAIDLHDAFALPEDGISYIIKQPFDGSPARLEAVSPDSLGIEWYPEPQERLSLATATLPELSSVDRHAAQTQRTYAKLHFVFNDVRRTEAPAKVLGKALVNFQDLVRAAGNYVMGRTANRGRFSEPVETFTQLAFVGSGAGSFEVLLAEIERPLQPRLIPGVSLLEDALTEVSDLMSDTSDPERFLERIVEYQPRFTSKYHDFLSDIRAAVTSTSLSWASPDPQRRGTAELNTMGIHYAISVLEDVRDVIHETIEVRGKVMAGDLIEPSFKMIADGITYKGPYRESALDTLDDFTLGQEYTASIRKTTTYRAASEQPRIKYELVELRPVVEPD